MCDFASGGEIEGRGGTDHSSIMISCKRAVWQRRARCPTRPPRHIPWNGTTPHRCTGEGYMRGNKGY